MNKLLTIAIGTAIIAGTPIKATLATEQPTNTEGVVKIIVEDISLKIPQELLIDITGRENFHIVVDRDLKGPHDEITHERSGMAGQVYLDYLWHIALRQEGYTASWPREATPYITEFPVGEDIIRSLARRVHHEGPLRGTWSFETLRLITSPF